MDIIIKIAEDFVNFYIKGRVRNYTTIIDKARNHLDEIDSHADKIKFLNIVLEGNNAAYDLHKLKCTNPNACDENFTRESINYFLTQELNRLGVQFDDDMFTTEEKNSALLKLDEILKDLADLKTGQDIIRNEMNELKDLFYLGKKKWHQLLIGKCFEMVASGIISKTISEKIITAFSQMMNNLLNG